MNVWVENACVVLLLYKKKKNLQHTKSFLKSEFGRDLSIIFLLIVFVYGPLLFIGWFVCYVFCYGM